MNNILTNLNNEQQEAVTHLNGPLLVLAGAGSGKTRVLISRIAHIIQNGCNPWNILSVTFTNKAAKEMKSRLENILGQDVVKDLWVGTFHNICGRILRQDIENYKTEDGKIWKKNFVIFDENDSGALIKNAVKAMNLDEKMYQPKMVKAAISMAKNKMQNAFNFASRARDYRTEKIAGIYNLYEEALAQNNALDFDDLLLMTVNLLTQNKEILEKYHNKFKHILVDEFQDTNLTQYRLINALYTAFKNPEELDKAKSLCVVGDIDQSIYSWRGADYKIILNFQSDFPKSSLIKLEQNYRSTGNILDAANSIIENNVERLSKNLYSNKGQGEKIKSYEAQDQAEEAYYIVRKIRAKGKEHFGKTAVLYRTNAQSRAIEEAFMSTGIPYRMVGGLKFYERKEIKDIVAYLKLIYNNSDSQSLKRVINVPKRSIGATTVKKLEELASEFSLSVFSVVNNIDLYADFSPATKAKLKEFANLINTLAQKQRELSLGEYIAFIFEGTGYVNELKEEGTEEAESRIENLQELVNVAREFEGVESEDELGEFLSQVALVSDIDEMTDENESVTLMTLHAAKGLEFPIVFLTGLEESVFPHSRSLNKLAEMEEERRLMYVGVTRAQDMLYITYAKRRQMWGEYRFSQVSRFISEIPANLLDANFDKNEEKSQIKSTFKEAVKNIESRKTVNFSKSDTVSSGGFGKNFVAPSSQKITASAGFGKNFVAPQIKKKEEETVKTEAPKRPPEKQPEPKIEFKNKINGIEEARAMVERLKAQKTAHSVATIEKVTVEPNAEAIITPKFEQGDKVFHETFGVGNVEEIITISSSTMYKVDFGINGKKAIDATFCRLKKID